MSVAWSRVWSSHVVSGSYRQLLTISDTCRWVENAASCQEPMPSWDPSPESVVEMSRIITSVEEQATRAECWRTVVQKAHIVLGLHILGLLSQYYGSLTQKYLYFKIYWTSGQCLQWEPWSLIKKLNELWEMKGSLVGVASLKTMKECSISECSHHKSTYTKESGKIDKAGKRCWGM